MKLAADSSSFLALFKLLLQIKREAKEAKQKSQDSSLFIKRLSRRFFPPFSSLLIPSLPLFYTQANRNVSKLLFI